MTVTFNPQAAADQTPSKKRVSVPSNPAGHRRIEGEFETRPNDYRVVGLGMVALSGMIMGFLIRWLM